MNIAVVGTGYVGLVSGACFAKMGNDVICVDVDSKKIENLKNGIIPIYEPGLKEIVNEYYEKKNLKFTTDIKEALKLSNIIFIAVGTPSTKEGKADLKYIFEVAKDIGKFMKHSMIIIDKSTVPVGTADKVYEIIKSELITRNLDIEFDVVSNPEFLKEGAAVDDFLKPDRVIIGAKNKKSFEILRELYSPFMKNHERLIEMDIRSAEMTKYAANSMLATKISFINEIACICEKVGADINMVRLGIGSDSRIGYSFIYPGCGYGGSCFPKDVDALIHTARKNGIEPLVLNGVKNRNNSQKEVLYEKIKSYFKGDLKDKIIAIWGLSFKPNTDDMREASSLVLVNLLLESKAKIQVYDPKAFIEAKKYFKGLDIIYAKNKYDALNNADAMILVTEWSEFRSPDFIEMKKRLKKAIIFDGRNQYDTKSLKVFGFKYIQIGVKNV